MNNQGRKTTWTKSKNAVHAEADAVVAATDAVVAVAADAGVDISADAGADIAAGADADADIAAVAAAGADVKRTTAVKRMTIDAVSRRFATKNISATDTTGIFARYACCLAIDTIRE